MAKTIMKPSGNSGSEDRFIELFCDAFGAEKGQYVYLQYPTVDIYGGHRISSTSEYLFPFGFHASCMIMIFETDPRVFDWHCSDYQDKKS